MHQVFYGVEMAFSWANSRWGLDFGVLFFHYFFAEGKNPACTSNAQNKKLKACSAAPGFFPKQHTTQKHYSIVDFKLTVYVRLYFFKSGRLAHRNRQNKKKRIHKPKHKTNITLSSVLPFWLQMTHTQKKKPQETLQITLLASRLDTVCCPLPLHPCSHFSIPLFFFLFNLHLTHKLIQWLIPFFTDGFWIL